VAASPARISAPRGPAPASTASAAAYGRSTPALLAKFDRATSSWRTSQLCLDGDLAAYSETWPRSGMTRSGTAYRLPPLARLTDEIGCGLLPTPTSGGFGAPNVDAMLTRRAALQKKYGNNGFGLTLNQMASAAMWPTPRADDARQDFAKLTRSSTGISLETAVAMNAIGGPLNPGWVSALMGFPPDWTEVE